MAFINQELAQVSGGHVGGDLHHFTHAVLAENLHNLGNRKHGTEISRTRFVKLRKT